MVVSLAFLTIAMLNSVSVASRKLTSLVEQPPLVLKYHKGALLKGNITVNLLWYGKFTPTQRSIIVDFIQSLSARHVVSPSSASWWQTTGNYYGGGPSTIHIGKQVIEDNYSMGKSLQTSQIVALASKAPHRNSINVVLTASDVAVDGFCMSRCGSHGSALARPNHKKSRFPYAWVGNPASQCPGQCAWPFHQPIYGPQTPPLVAPSGDVGVDGMIINLATVLAGTVTNPYNDGYFQGPATAPLEAVSACTGIFGSGSYPGYAGSHLVDKTTGASYNAYGQHGRKYLLPAIWDPKTSICKTLM